MDAIEDEKVNHSFNRHAILLKIQNQYIIRKRENQSLSNNQSNLRWFRNKLYLYKYRKFS